MKKILFALIFPFLVASVLIFPGCENIEKSDLRISIYTIEDDNIVFKEIEEDKEYIVAHNFNIDSSGLNWELNFYYDGYIFIYMADDNGQLFSGDSEFFQNGQYTKYNENIKVSNFSLQNGDAHIAFSAFHFDSNGEILYNDEPSYIYIYTYITSPIEDTDQTPTGIYGIRLVRSGDGYSDISLIYRKQE